jgi:hypothetical protein
MRHVSTGVVAAALLALTVLATTDDAEATSLTQNHAGSSPRSELSRQAPTSTTIGSTAGTLSLNCSNTFTFAQTQTGPGQPGYVVPTDGVITAFSTKANANPGNQIRMVLFGSPTGSSYPVAAKSSFRALIVSTVNTFEVRVPVRAGWLLGAGFLGTATACVNSGTAEDRISLVNAGDVDTDSSVTLAPLTIGLVDIAAVVEPDVDGDGFGDVSQDRCPVSALAQAACPAPETTITRAPKAHTGKRKVKLAFASSVPGSLFLVAVDGRKAVPSLSPFVRKLGYGRHRITVQAVSPLSPVDPTPASVSFKVKKKAKHR